MFSSKEELLHFVDALRNQSVIVAGDELDLTCAMLLCACVLAAGPVFTTAIIACPNAQAPLETEID